MESLEHAQKRGANIIAEYLGGAINCDAYHMTDPRADGLGVSSCIEKSLEDAGVAPEEVCTLLSAEVSVNDFEECTYYVEACIL
jgi:3-oxoacyl-(acyl-carrier-protein) synthase